MTRVSGLLRSVSPPCGPLIAFVAASGLAVPTFRAAATPAPSLAAPAIEFNIPAEDLGRALKALGGAAHKQLLFSDVVVAGRRSTELRGRYTLDDALRILLAGSNLKVDRTKSDVISIRRTAFFEPAPGDSRAREDAAAASSAPAAAVAASEAASAAEGAGLAEVIVTATRREEAIEKVPLSVKAITDVQMEVAGVREMSDIVRLTPGLQVNQSNNGSNNIAIRGIASSAGAATTGVYLDDTPIQVRQLQYAAATLFPVVFDLQRVEVLRGPQGTLFGAGSEGGTVRFIQEQPSLHQSSGYARAEGANTDGHAASYEAGASYGGPIVEDTVGFRVSAYYRQDGGYIDYGPVQSFTVNHASGAGLAAAATMVPNIAATQDNVNWTDTKAFHAALEFAPTQSLTITPSYFYQRQDQGFSNNTFYLSGSNPDAGFFFVPQFTPGPVGASVCSAPCPTPGPLTRLHLPSGLFGNTTLSVSALNIQWNIGEAATLTSTSSYVYIGKVNYTDTTLYYSVQSVDHGLQPFPLPGQYSPTLDQDSNKAATQEFRLSGTSKHLNWQVGAFLSHNTQISFEYEENNVWPGANYFFGQYVPPGGPPFGAGYSSFDDYWGSPLLNDSGTYYAYADNTENQYAAFAQFDVKFNPVWTLTAGARYSYNNLKYSLISLGVENNENTPSGAPCPTGPVCPYGSGVFAPAFPTGIQTASARPTTPKVALNAQVTENNLLYLSATKGFRMGGAELPLPSDCGVDLTALGYVNANGKPYSPLTYNPDYVWSYEFGTKNTAADGKFVANASVYVIKWKNIQTRVSLPTCGYALIANSGSATVKGFDLDAQVVPIHGLQLRTDIAYTQTSLDDGLYEPSGAAVYSRGSAIPSSGAPWEVVASGRYDFALPLNAELRGYAYVDDTWQSQWPRTGRDDPTVFNYLPSLLSKLA